MLNQRRVQFLTRVLGTEQCVVVEDKVETLRRVCSGSTHKCYEGVEVFLIGESSTWPCHVLEAWMKSFLIMVHSRTFIVIAQLVSDPNGVLNHEPTDEQLETRVKIDHI